MTAITIRAVERADVGAVWALFAEIDRHDGGERQKQGTPASLESALFDPTTRCGGLVAVDPDAALVGLALFHRFRAPHSARATLFLDDLYVRPARRNRGLGRRFMRALARLAVEWDCEQIDWTTGASNLAGLRFYRRLGAQVFDRTRYCRLFEPALQTLAREESED